MSKKAKIGLTSIIVIFVIIIVISVYVMSHAAKIQETDFIVQYGQKVNITSMDIYGKNVDADIDLSTIQNEAGKKYPGIGEYTGTVTYNGMTSNLTIRVVDTAKPKWIKAPKKVHLGLYESKHNFKKEFKAKDPSEIKYSFDTSDVNFNKAGTYHAVAKAKDSHGNTAKKKFKVVVEYQTDAAKQNTQGTNNAYNGYYGSYDTTQNSYQTNTKKASKSKKTTSSNASYDPYDTQSSTDAYTASQWNPYGYQ